MTEIGPEADCLFLDRRARIAVSASDTFRILYLNLSSGWLSQQRYTSKLWVLVRES